MILHYLQHVPFEGLGSIENWAKDSGHRVTRTRFHSADPLPAPGDVGLLVIMGGPMNVYEEALYPWLVAAERLVGLQFHLEVTQPGAAGLIEHCRGDFELPGPFVQDPREILADEGRFRKANHVLVPLLNHLAALT